MRLVISSETDCKDYSVMKLVSGMALLEPLGNECLSGRFLAAA